jgi:hypothetical protein
VRLLGNVTALSIREAISWLIQNRDVEGVGCPCGEHDDAVPAAAGETPSEVDGPKMTFDPDGPPRALSPVEVARRYIEPRIANAVRVERAHVGALLGAGNMLCRAVDVFVRCDSAKDEEAMEAAQAAWIEAGQAAMASITISAALKAAKECNCGTCDCSLCAPLWAIVENGPDR